MACYFREKEKFSIVSVSLETRNRCLLKADVDTIHKRCRVKICRISYVNAKLKITLTLCFALPVSTEIRISIKRLQTCYTTRWPSVKKRWAKTIQPWVVHVWQLITYLVLWDLPSTSLSFSFMVSLLTNSLKIVLSTLPVLKIIEKRTEFYRRGCCW